MQKVLLIAVSLMFSFQALAVEMQVANCWKGYSNKEQQQNLALCRTQKSELQICSSNMFEHKQAAFDVCLMKAATDPQKLVSCAKGYNQREQNANLASCKIQRQLGQLCISSMFVHKQAAFDVCLME